ncbi:MAG: TonB-dependent receptor [Acidobacteriota bacterium]
MTRNLLNAAFVALLLTLCAVGRGQTITGNIIGRVTDPSGAVVPNAKVSARNVETGVVVSTVTNSVGAYSVRFLQIGNYTVAFEADGFKKQVFPAFRVEQDSTVKVDAKLAVGAATDTIEVQGVLPPLLNTEDATTSTTFDSNTIENITNKGRNFSLFTALIPGAVNTSPQQLSGTFATERDTAQVSEIGVNGNRAQENSYVLDGVEINETIGNLIGYNPNLDALGEVKVVSANPSAEYGNANGSTVLAVTKSGTNEFHGGAALYIENHLLDANTWDNNRKAIARPPYTQSIFTAKLGGPVLVPWLFNGRNKLFFFVDYEGTRTQQGGNAAVSVLSVKERTGDFSELLDTNVMCGGDCGKPGLAKTIQLYDPANNFAPYPNNQIPVLSPLVKFLVAHPEIYPLPNSPSLVGSPNNSNYVGSQKTTSRNDQGDVKIDWTPTNKDRVSFRYLQGEGSDFQRQPLAIIMPTPGDYPAKGFTVNYVHTFNAKIVNEFRCCFFRTRYTNSVPYDSTGLFGSKGNAVIGIPGGQVVPGFSQHNFPFGNGVSAYGSLGGGSDQVENIFNYSDNLTIQHGHHLFKMGVQFERYQQNYSNAAGGALGSFGFANFFTSNPNVGAGNTTTPNGNGFATADFVLDRVDTEGYGGVTGKVGQRQWRDGYFFQDDWKILPNLTLNLGARYQYDQPGYEVNNKENNPQANGDGTVTILTAGVNGASRALYHPVYNDFLPRVGIEYQYKPWMVLSVGYGMVSEMEGGGSGNRLVQNAPFQYTFSLQATPPTKSAAGTFFQETNGFSSTNPSFTGSTYQSFNPHLQPSVVQQYNLTTQYQLGRTSVLKVGYVGEKGYHLIEEYRGNQAHVPCYVNGAIKPITTAGCQTSAPTPFSGLVGQGGNVIVTDSEGIMEYDALQIQYRQLPWKGLESTVNYAYGRGMTDTTGFQAVAAVNGTGVAPENSYNLPLNWGPVGQDERHTLNANMVYTLPFGRGKEYFATVNHFTDELIGGWKVSMVLLAYTGFPNTESNPTQNIQTYYNGAPQQRPNKVGILPKLPRTPIATGGVNWFGAQSAQTIAQAYVDPAAPNTNDALASFGTAKVGDLRGPGYAAVDFSAFKDFTIYAEHKIGFEVDAYNAVNTTNYGNPTANIGSASFGQITSVRGASRTVQVAAKYQF